MPVALPAPIPPAPVVASAPAPVVVTEAPAPVVTPVTPAPPDEPMTPLAPKATPDFSLVPGPDPTRFPQPPYPYSARIAGLSGTVVVNVQFDQRGGVVSAEIAQSSGVPILDDATKSFILSHWHLPLYAGQSVTVPVVFIFRPDHSG
jgi:protein TonB